ncbi:MAG: AAA family ATPase [Lachnospiraceae bacterium]|nr:AAA family ATPase [Lachnospiraceae bacterium]
MKKNNKLAIGIQDFRSLCEQNAYYVDKTQMIEEFLESWYQVTLVTRPRRFGKTLNMSMLAEFLDCTKNSRSLFAETKISCSDAMQELNGHPVIFLSFLNVKGDTAEELLYQLEIVIKEEYEKFLFLTCEEAFPDRKKQSFLQTYSSLCQPGNEIQKRNCISHGITELCQFLESYYGKKVYFLLDEYDTPFISANSGGYYHEVRGILSNMLSSALKGNSSLEKAMLTGIQRAAKENIFSGLNNLIVCTVKDPEYTDCFGFTETETAKLLHFCNAELSESVKNMYDGYQFGSTEVYNPWSVTCYAARKKLEPYWVNTSENILFKQALTQRKEPFFRKYDTLIQKGSVNVHAELSSPYYENPSDSSLWGLFINAGMASIQEELEENFYTLKIPNQEVWKSYQELTAFYLQTDENHLSSMLQHLRTEAIAEFAEEYQLILLNLPSYHDLKNENSYHMMMLGMCAFLHPYYTIDSNREHGMSRSGIMLYAKRPNLAHIILEFKYTNNQNQNLEKLALEAIAQIKNKKYDVETAGNIYYIGLAHCGKNVRIKWERHTRP